MKPSERLIRITSLIYLIFFVASSFCQTDTTNKVRYTNEYKFKEGFFISFDQVLENNPMPFERIISGDKNSENWLDNILKSKTFLVLDDFGVQQTVEVNQTWGYCKKGALYVNWDKDFYRIPYIGRISHYVATQTVRMDYMADPYYGYYPGMMGPSYETNKIVQNIIDFESGKSYPFTLETVQTFLMKDPVLFDEFNQLKKNKKRQMMFLFIRRYNERNPIYFPIQ